jgi:hypothetical protein
MQPMGHILPLTQPQELTLNVLFVMQAQPGTRA